MKKTVKVLIISIITILLCTTTYASNEIIQIVDKSAETKNLENNQGYMSKNIINTNAEQGEVTIELKLTNTSEKIQKTSTTEVMLVLDNSSSMNTNVDSSGTRKNLIVDSTTILVNQLFEQNSNIKVGLVKFGEKASMVCDLTNNKQTVLNAITTYKNATLEGSTNISTAITTANNKFSTNSSNKILVLLTDGIPSADTSGSLTKNALLSAANTGTYIISLVTGVNSDVVTKIFGTQSSPTTGKFYNIEDTSINQIISGNIFKDIAATMQNPITDITITDYFPKDILDNFDFSYIKKPSSGTISENIENNYIIMHINKLQAGEEIIIQYVLKLKDNYNQELLNKVISTNEKVELKYKDYTNKQYTVTLDTSPKIKITTNDSSNFDNTINNNILPATGNNIKIILLVIISLIIVTILIIQNKRYKDIK